MKKMIFLAIFLFTSLNVSAASESSFCPIDDKGKIKALTGYEISKIQVDGHKETYTLTPDDSNPYGGSPITWVALKDEQGRIIKIESGGERPSQKLINFENRKWEESQSQKLAARKKLDKPFSLPSKDSFKEMLLKAEDVPIKFGGIIEMSYVGSKCFVTKVADKFFDQKTKSNLESVYFSTERCEKVRALYSKFQNDINECAEKIVAHERELSSINKAVSLSPGVGGGGGSPIRDIASIEEEYMLPSDFLNALDFKRKSKLHKQKELCDVLDPLKSTSDKEKTSPSGGKASSVQ